MSHRYTTLSQPGESLHKVKGSKHLGFAYPVESEEEVEEKLNHLRATHHTAVHVCYAWRLGIDHFRHRANDDGEPSNSAGQPILGQIEKYNLTQVLVAVVRYFGGTKLGVGGLIDAYSTAAQEAIEAAEIVERTLMAHFRLHFSYDRMSDVMLALRTRQWEAFNHNFKHSCALDLQLSPEKESELFEIFAGFDDIRIETLGLY